MIERTKMYSRPKGCTCEQFAYLPNMVVYPTSSDMNELGVIGRCGLKKSEGR